MQALAGIPWLDVLSWWQGEDQRRADEAAAATQRAAEAAAADAERRRALAEALETARRELAADIAAVTNERLVSEALHSIGLGGSGMALNVGALGSLADMLGPVFGLPPGVGTIAANVLQPQPAQQQFRPQIPPAPPRPSLPAAPAPSSWGQSKDDNTKLYLIGGGAILAAVLILPKLMKGGRR